MNEYIGAVIFKISTENLVDYLSEVFIIFMVPEKSGITFYCMIFSCQFSVRITFIEITRSYFGFDLPSYPGTQMVSISFWL